MTRGEIEAVVEERSGIAVLRLSGELTSVSEATVASAYRALQFEGGPKLVIDFEGTRYINSAGIAALVSIVADVTKRSGLLKLAGLQPHYQRVMQIVGITNYVTLHDDLDSAVAAMEEA
jgi:anti-sigma B factor antagonist